MAVPPPIRGARMMPIRKTSNETEFETLTTEFVATEFVTTDFVSTDFRLTVGDVRDGLPYAALERLQEAAALTQGQMATLLGIPERTIARRKNEGRLTATESDRVDRTERILRLAAEVLEDAGKARTWLQRPNRGLGGETPLSMLDTDRGVRAVEGVLMRLEHGIYG